MGVWSIKTPVTIVYISSMIQSYPEYWPQYFTATIYQWKHVLADNQGKDIIIDSFKFMVTNKWIELNAFVPIAIGMSKHTCLQAGNGEIENTYGV